MALSGTSRWPISPARPWPPRKQPAVDDDAAADAALHHEEERHARPELAVPVGRADGEGVGVVLRHDRHLQRQRAPRRVLRRFDVLPASSGATGRSPAGPSGPASPRRSPRSARASLQATVRMPGQLPGAMASSTATAGHRTAPSWSRQGWPRDRSRPRPICSTPISTPTKQTRFGNELETDAGSAALPRPAAGSGAAPSCSRTRPSDSSRPAMMWPEDDRLSRSSRARSARLSGPNRCKRLQRRDFVASAGCGAANWRSARRRSLRFSRDRQSPARLEGATSSRSTGKLAASISVSAAVRRRSGARIGGAAACASSLQLDEGLGVRGERIVVGPGVAPDRAGERQASSTIERRRRLRR